MKYLRHNSIGIVTWRAGQGLPNHADMAEALCALVGGRMISAGFVGFHPTTDKLVCYGDSLTLGLGSSPDDTELLNRQLSEI